jgi:hypothetical protein
MDGHSLSLGYFVLWQTFHASSDKKSAHVPFGSYKNPYAAAKQVSRPCLSTLSQVQDLQPGNSGAYLEPQFHSTAPILSPHHSSPKVSSLLAISQTPSTPPPQWRPLKSPSHDWRCGWKEKAEARFYARRHVVQPRLPRYPTSLNHDSFTKSRLPRNTSRSCLF